MSPVTRKSAEGLPLFYLRDIPPVATGGPEIREPRIYYGEETDSYVIVKGSTPEFDYPKGKDNIYAAYDGTGGVPWPDRVENPVRLVLQRREPAALELHHRRQPDHDPPQHPGTGAHDRSIPAPRPRSLSGDQRWAAVLDAGRLYDERLFSLCAAGARLRLNYIRNSVKVVVDAYNGTVDFYLMDAGDPIAATYQRIFPGLFKPFAAMPPGLQKHIRYPEDLFLIQARLYRLPHGGGRRFL